MAELRNPRDGGGRTLLLVLLLFGGRRSAGKGEDHHEDAEAEAAVVDEDEALPVGAVNGLLLFGQGGRGCHLVHKPQHNHD